MLLACHYSPFRYLLLIAITFFVCSVQNAVEERTNNSDSVDSPALSSRLGIWRRKWQRQAEEKELCSWKHCFFGNWFKNAFAGRRHFIAKTFVEDGIKAELCRSQKGSDIEVAKASQLRAFASSNDIPIQKSFVSGKRKHESLLSRGRREDWGHDGAAGPLRSWEGGERCWNDAHLRPKAERLEGLPLWHASPLDARQRLPAFWPPARASQLCRMLQIDLPDSHWNWQHLDAPHWFHWFCRGHHHLLRQAFLRQLSPWYPCKLAPIQSLINCQQSFIGFRSMTSSSFCAFSSERSCAWHARHCFTPCRVTANMSRPSSVGWTMLESPSWSLDRQYHGSITGSTANSTPSWPT